MFRREMFLGITGLLVTPAIVRKSSLMRLSFPSLSLIHDGPIMELEWFDGPIIDFNRYPYGSVQATFADGFKERYPTGGAAVAFNQVINRMIAQAGQGALTAVAGQGVWTVERGCGLRFIPNIA